MPGLYESGSGLPGGDVFSGFGGAPYWSKPATGELGIDPAVIAKGRFSMGLTNGKISILMLMGLVVGIGAFYTWTRGYQY